MTWSDILKNLMISQKSVRANTNKLSKSAGYKTNTQKSVLFLYISNEQLENETD